MSENETVEMEKETEVETKEEYEKERKEDSPEDVSILPLKNETLTEIPDPSQDLKRQLAEKEEQWRTEKELLQKQLQQQRDENEQLQKKAKPVSVGSYFLYLLLMSFLPYVIGALLGKLYGEKAVGFYRTLLSMSGPLLHGIFLLLFSFAAWKENVRNFARAWFLFLLMIIAALALSGMGPATITYLSKFAFH